MNLYYEYLNGSEMASRLGRNDSSGALRLGRNDSSGNVGKMCKPKPSSEVELPR